MEPFSVASNLGADDWRVLQQSAQRRLWAPQSLASRLLLRLPILLIIGMLFSGIFWLDRDDQLLPWIVGCMGTLLLGGVQLALLHRVMRPKPGGLAVGPVRLDFDAQGITIARPNSVARVQWSQFRGAEETATHLLVWVDVAAGYVIPARDLPAPLDIPIAAERIRAFAVAAATAPPVVPPTFADSAPAAVLAVSPPPASAASVPIELPPRASVISQLGAVLGQLLLLPVNGARFVGSDLAIGLLAALLLAIWLPLDPLVFDGPLEFAPEAISGLVFVVAGALTLAWLLARLSRPQVEYRRTLLVVTGSLAIAILGSTLAALVSSRWFLIVVCLVVAYATLYFKLAFRAMTGLVQTRALLAGAAAALFFVVLMDRLYINPSVWVYADSEETDEADDGSYAIAARRMAEVQFGQQARIDAEVARIATHTAAGSQVYFLGFAGVGEQRVFAEEIGLAARRIAQRYGAVDRELQLVNDRRDLEQYPLATAVALRHSLKALGDVMDEDDVLFLAVSSHGGEDASLAISNVGMLPTELDAETLASALEESGIRWKVIVISACYGGGFIDALQDDHTIILTAAAADRTSFGCSGDRDLTYFGEAFYRDALPGAKSLRAAFDAAKASIASREKAEGITASNPQASYGAALEAKLAALE